MCAVSFSFTFSVYCYSVSSAAAMSGISVSVYTQCEWAWYWLSGRTYNCRERVDYEINSGGKIFFYSFSETDKAMIFMMSDS